MITASCTQSVFIEISLDLLLYCLINYVDVELTLPHNFYSLSILSFTMTCVVDKLIFFLLRFYYSFIACMLLVAWRSMMTTAVWAKCKKRVFDPKIKIADEVTKSLTDLSLFELINWNLSIRETLILHSVIKSLLINEFWFQVGVEGVVSRT